MNATLSVLRDNSIFRGLPEAALTELTRLGHEVHFARGARLMTQGESAGDLFVVLRGRVAVERSRGNELAPLRLAELGPGEVVGEMGVLDKAPRSATVIALEDTDAFALSAPALAIVMLESPAVAVQLLHLVSQRLRNTDELAEWMLSGGRN